MDGARNVSPSDTLSATAGTYGNQRLRPGQREFQRAYKACISCRKRKTRCDVSAEDYADGKPCTRCRRELKECVFPIERPAAKQHRISKTRGLQERVPENGNRSREPNVEETDLEGRDTSSLLTDSVVRTVVNSGNDALNLLFEAATQRQHGMEDMPPLHSRDRTSHEMQASLYSSQANSTSPFTAKVLGAPSAILNVWKSCRFVKMGWFSAEEAVWFVER